MKKCIFCLVLIIFLWFCFSGENGQVFLEDTIRFRVIANSNSTSDQNLKMEVATVLEKEITSRIKDIDNIHDARDILSSSLFDFENIVHHTLLNQNMGTTFKIKYGMNYFPKKNYQQIEYPEGYYESLVVTLGDGLGENWWCVLFPPVCLMEKEQEEEVSYHFFLIEFFENLFS